MIPQTQNALEREIEGIESRLVDLFNSHFEPKDPMEKAKAEYRAKGGKITRLEDGPEELEPGWSE